VQARFKAFEEKTNQQKVDELMLAHDSLTEAEAETLLRICNNNEFEAGDRQGLTLVHFSAQLERFVWDRGARKGCVARVEGMLGCV